jgi:hypothetical protein
MQMLLADVLIDAALQDRKVILGSIAMSILSDVFLFSVNNDRGDERLMGDRICSIVVRDGERHLEQSGKPDK